MRAQSYKELTVWKKGVTLVITIYALTEKFPASELFGLTSQMRRAAVSIPSNIAEGSRRSGSKESIRFYQIAFGSGAELETQLEIVKRLPFSRDIALADACAILDEVMRMLNKLAYN